MVGAWKYKNYKSVILFLVAVAILSIPAVFLILIVPTLIKQAIAVFISMSIGAIWTGIGLVYMIPALKNKFHWIIYTKNIPDL